MLSFAAPLLDRITTPFHACSETTVEGVDEVLLLRVCLLITRVPLLSRLSATDHGTGNGTNSRSRPCIAGDCPDRRASRSTAKRAAHPLAAPNRRPGLLWHRSRGNPGGINAGVLLRPRVALRVVFTLLCCALAFRRINDWFLCFRRDGER